MIKTIDTRQGFKIFLRHGGYDPKHELISYLHIGQAYRYRNENVRDIDFLVKRA